MPRRELQFKFQDVADDNGVATFEGMASVFGNVDDGRDVVAPGAFKRSLKERTPKLLLHHGFGAEGGTPVGKWLEVKETDPGLAVKGKLFLETDHVRLAYRAMKEDALDGLSIGYIPEKWTTDATTGIRTLKQVNLEEISIVTWPMNRSARVEAVKSRLADGEELTIRELEEILREAGFSREQAKGIAARGHPGLKQRDAAAAELIDSINQARGVLK